jgi:hypothetical protein
VAQRGRESRLSRADTASKTERWHYPAIWA